MASNRLTNLASLAIVGMVAATMVLIGWYGLTQESAPASAIAPVAAVATPGAPVVTPIVPEVVSQVATVASLPARGAESVAEVAELDTIEVGDTSAVEAPAAPAVLGVEAAPIADTNELAVGVDAAVPAAPVLSADTALSAADSSALLIAIRQFFSMDAWSVGVDGGIARTRLVGKSSGFDDRRNGLTIGVFADRTLFGPLGVRAGLAYHQRGGASRIGGSAVVVLADYLEMPVMVRYRAIERWGFTSYGYAGMTFGFRLGCRLDFGTTGTAPEPCDDGTGYGAPRPRDAALLYGLGVQRPWREFQLELGLRFNEGLVSMGAPLDARLSGWTLTTGISMPLARRASTMTFTGGQR